MIAEKLHNIGLQIEHICKTANRNFQEVKLIAVSKNFSADFINEAIKSGQVDFGENRAQELLMKTALINDNIHWHFIGTIQKNKIKHIVSAAEYIHSVSELEQILEIQKQAEKQNKHPKILLEVKTSSEESKSGFNSFKEVAGAANFCLQQSNISLIGLMTIAPFVENKNEIREAFKKAKNYLDELNKSGFNLSQLSMGMSDDFDIAIEEGATMVRIGSAIFGKRDYNFDWRKL